MNTPPADLSGEYDWSELRKLTRRLVPSALGWGPFAFAVFHFARPYRASFHALPLLLLAPYLAWLMYLGLGLRRFACPRCRKRFFVKEDGGIFAKKRVALSRSCLNCGLPRYAPRDPGPFPVAAAGAELERFFARALRALFWPLTLAAGLGAAAGFTLTPAFRDFFNLGSVSAHRALIFAWIGLTQFTSFILALFACTALGGRDARPFLRQAATPALSSATALCLAGAFALGIEGQLAYLIPFACGISIVSLEWARRVRRFAAARRCLQGHSVDDRAVHCAACGAVLD